MPTDPAQQLTDLIRLRQPVGVLAPLVEALPFLQADLVELRAGDVSIVLQRFLAGEISGEDVGAWASALDRYLFDAVWVRDEAVGDVVRQMALEADSEGRVWEHHADVHLSRLRAILGDRKDGDSAHRKLSPDVPSRE